MSCRTAGNARRRHTRFRSGIQGTEKFHAGIGITDQFSKLQLIFMKQTGHRTARIQQFFDLFPNFRRIRTQNGRSARLQKIDVFVSIDVVKIGAFGFRHHQRKRIIKSQIMLNSAGNVIHRLLDHFFGFLTLGLVIVQIFFHCFFFNSTDRHFNQRVQLIHNFPGIMILLNGITGPI